MSRITRSVIGLALGAGLVCPLAAQRTFDGVVAYQVTGMADQPVQLVFMSKGSKVRQEIVVPGMPQLDGGVQLFDYVRGQMTSLLPGRRQYTTADFRSGTRADSPGGPSLHVRPTGKRETIAGIGCEVYTVDGEGGGEVCVATTLGHFIAIEGQAGMVALGNDGGRGWHDPRFAEFMRYFKDGAVPLRFVLGGDGRRQMTFTATRVERKALPDELFRVPTGYTLIGGP